MPQEEKLPYRIGNMWYFPDGKMLPVVSGGDGSGAGSEGSGTGSEGSEGGGGGNGLPKTFTQDEVNRLMAREKNDGRRSRERELLEALGVSSLDDVKKAIDERKEAENKNKTEAQRLREEAEAEKRAAEEAKLEATRERLRAKVERALMKAGVDDEEVEMVAELVKVADDADAEAVAEAVEALKQKMPRLFSTEPGGKQTQDPKPKSGDPGRPPRRTPPANTRDAALELVRQRHPNKTKSS